MDIVAGAVLAIVIAIGLYLLYQNQMGNPRSRDKRFAAMAATQLSSVDAEGVHRLSGIARPLKDPPSSPVSGRRYIALDVLVQAHSDGVSRRTHRTAVDFLLDDGTGLALVLVSATEVAIEHDHEAPRASLDTVPFADEVLRSGGVRIGSPSTCQVRMFEGVIEPGSRVEVLGRLEPADAAATAAGATWIVRDAADSPLLVRPDPDLGPSAL